MNLAVVETCLLRALQPLAALAQLHAGPPHVGPGTGARAEVFVHARRFTDAGGRTDDGAQVAPRRLPLAGRAWGLAEERPGHIDIEITSVAAQHLQAQWLAGLVAPLALQALARLKPVMLTDPADPACRVRLADMRSWLHASESGRQVDDGVALHQARLTLRLAGFLHVQLTPSGGLQPLSVFDGVVPRLELVADVAGPDVAREHLRLHNPGPLTLDLAGWVLQDMATRPHRYVFPAPCPVAAGGTLTLWTGRGHDDAANRYWGRRQAVWTNAGDSAVLLDPDGVERARASHTRPAAPPRQRTARKTARR